MTRRRESGFAGFDSPDGRSSDDGGDDANTHDTTMNENDSTTIENSLETIYAEGTAHVEDFRIRPVEVESDRLVMKVLMRIGGGEAIYYLSATATYSDDEGAGHHVTIRRRGAGIVGEFETDVVTATPSDWMDATQAVHETYLDAVQEWYDYAAAADTAGDE